MKTNCGVYRIVNIATGDCYIGQSRDLRVRRNHHFSNLKLGRHWKVIQADFDKHGKENFKFEILVYCEPDELTRYEQAFVDMFNPIYNTNANCHPHKGAPQSEETRRKIAEYNTGKPKSEETRRKMAEAKLGKKRSPETILKIITTKRNNRNPPPGRGY
jgi:group I intron endonuclease